MGFLNRLRGEEPGMLRQIAHLLEGKGAYGEYLTDYALDHGDIPGRYTTFNNVYVPTRGRTTEIDVLMLHERGILVIESKNYSGWIFGSVDQKQWTQVFKGGVKEHFYSPVKQNRSHINALRNHLGLDESAFVSLIVFSERCKLKKVPDNTPELRILQRQHLVREVNRILGVRERMFSDGQMDELEARLAELLKTDEKAGKHIETVKAIKNGELCPWCGAELVRRESEHGAFLGCSTFPKCRYTVDIKEPVAPYE